MINCPKQHICQHNKCDFHIEMINRYDVPVHSPCDWYYKHLKQLERKEKIKKLEK